MKDPIEKEVYDMVQELIAKAKKDGIKSKPYNTRSSLDRLLKSRRQAEHFMLLLEYEKNKP